MAYEDKLHHVPPAKDGYAALIGTPPPPPEPCKRPSGLPWEGYYYSSYGIAVKHGFKGTEEEWLESLHGRDGKNGVIDLNSGNEFRIWVGSLEEYNALPDLMDDVLYFLEEPVWENAP